MLFSLCAHKNLLHFGFVYMWINKLKNQRLEIIYISTFLQVLDDIQNKVEISYFDFEFMWINHLKNQHLGIIHISTFLQALDDNQNKVEM